MLRRYATAREFQRDLESYLGGPQNAKIGPASIAAMLKPHFVKDRIDQHRSVEAFLKKAPQPPPTLRFGRCLARPSTRRRGKASYVACSRRRPATTSTTCMTTRSRRSASCPFGCNSRQRATARVARQATSLRTRCPSAARLPSPPVG